MTLSADAIELAIAFESELERGGRPSIEEFLQRSPNPADRMDLLLQLLACESGHAGWEIDSLGAKIDAFPELLSCPDRVAELLRTVYCDRIAGRVPTPWDMFRRFGLSADELRLSLPGERHFLGQTLLGRYELVERLGAGTFGVVFRATDSVLGGPVAVKVPHYPRRPELAAAMLRREWQVGSSLTHPRIVSSKAFEDTAEVVCLVMEYMAGGSLLRLLGSGPLDSLTACRIAMQVTQALEHAHAAGIFHRDIKPENILLDINGDAFVSDFGIALSFDEQWDKEGEVAGTFPYMAPELLFGGTHRIDGRADLWSVGMVLLEMLTGTRLAHGSRREEALAAAVVQGKKEVNLSDGVPALFGPILTRCLRLDPNERYDSVGQLGHHLDEATSILASGRAPQGATQPVTGDLLHTWRLGIKMGWATANHEAFSSCCSEIIPLLLEPRESLPLDLIGRILSAVMHEVGAVKAYNEARSVARDFGLVLPETPEASARSINIFYRGRRLVKADLSDLPLLVESFSRVLITADTEATEWLRSSGDEAAALYLFAREAARNRHFGEPATFARDACAAGIPDQLWNPFAEALRAGAKTDEIEKAFNQMDKRIERFLAERP